MTAIELYRYIHENNIEWHRYEHEGEMDILICPYWWHIEDFCKLLGASDFEDAGVECHIKDNYFAIWMSGICDHHDIDIDEVFGKESSNV
jgi:hypothetical protein